jgi:fimbrial chaperone protein
MGWLVCLVLVLACPFLAYAGVQLSATRVIYKEGLREGGLTVRNQSSNSTPHLIQSWITDATGADTSAMIVVPPLFRLDPDASRMLRIVKSEKALLSDQETLFWLNVKVVPSSDKNARNVLNAVVTFQLKLLYRPSGIKGDSGEAYKKLTFTRSEVNRLTIYNPTPFYVSLYSLVVDSESIDVPNMLAPYQKVTYSVPSRVPKEVSWCAVDDYGARTNMMNFNF